MSRFDPNIGCGAVVAALLAAVVIYSVVMSFRVPPVRELARQCRVALMAAPELDGAIERSLNLWFDHTHIPRGRSRSSEGVTHFHNAEREEFVESTNHLNFDVSTATGPASGTCSMGFSQKLSLTFSAPR